VPRPNQARSVLAEVDLAERIAFERDRRGLSYEALAALMTDAGCPIQGSAIYRIEKGTPPRKISVAELVTLAQIWGFTVEQLLEPVALLEQRRGLELAKELAETPHAVQRAIARQFGTLVEYLRIAATSEDLRDYIKGHEERETGGIALNPVTMDDVGTKVTKNFLTAIEHLVVDALNSTALLARECVSTDSEGSS